MDRYVKGTATHIIDRDEDGNPTLHIETDPDGGLWLVDAKSEDGPRQVRPDEIASLGQESKNKGRDRG